MPTPIICRRDGPLDAVLSSRLVFATRLMRDSDSFLVALGRCVGFTSWTPDRPRPLRRGGAKYFRGRRPPPPPIAGDEEAVRARLAPPATSHVPRGAVRGSGRRPRRATGRTIPQPPRRRRAGPDGALRSLCLDDLDDPHRVADTATTVADVRASTRWSWRASRLAARRSGCRGSEAHAGARRARGRALRGRAVGPRLTGPRARPRSCRSAGRRGRDAVMLLEPRRVTAAASRSGAALLARRRSARRARDLPGSSVATIPRPACARWRSADGPPRLLDDLR